MRSVQPTPDPGVAPQRTHLAWVRTAASMMVVGALHLRLGAIAGGGLAFMPGLFVLAIGLLIFAAPTRQRLGVVADHPAGDMPAYLAMLAATSIALASGATVAITFASRW